MQQKDAIATKCATPRKHRQNLNLREKRLIKAIPKSKTMSEAMRTAGYAESYINCGHRKEITQKPTIIEIMEKHGLTDDFCMKTHLDGMKATKVISATVIYKSKDGIADQENGMADAHSMTKDFIDVEDYPTRHKYLETAYNLKGYLKTKLDVEHSGVVQIIHMPGKLPKGAQ